MKCLISYEAFLRAKMALAPSRGFEVFDHEINPLLKPHQRDIVKWAVRQGCAAIFAAFGLGKSIIQIEILRLVVKKLNEQRHERPDGWDAGLALIICPLSVRQEFIRDALLDTNEWRQRAKELGLDHAKLVKDFGVEFKFIRSTDEVRHPGFWLTNYESVREGKVDVTQFDVASLDEADVLRGFGGTKTFREFIRLFEHEDVKYRFVATATPDPNEFIELLAYAAFLGVMDVGQGKTRFFKRDSTKADKLTLHAHKEREFWLWVSTWAVFVQKPSDLGYDDAGYALPELEIHWHEIGTDHAQAGHETNGQAKLLKNAAIGVQDAAREKRDSLPARITKLLELRAIDPEAHRIIWHDLEAERWAIEAYTEAVSIYGSQDLDQREKAIVDFSNGLIKELAAKPVIAGSGCNFQRYCAWEIFLGIGFKFKDFIQAIHRCYRFLQTKPVRLDLIYTEAERGVRAALEAKWQRYKEQTEKMSEIIRQYGLAANALHSELARVCFDQAKRVEISGESFKAINNDCVFETSSMPADSVGLILTSIPFSMQYEYTPSYNDFGHTDSNAHFWEQMDFLIPELLRVLKPGRVAAIHVKDRIVPGGINGLGFQTVYRFSDDCCSQFENHGFAFLGRKTIVTDVVRENNQTYRLGWSEQCKDGSRMGFGMPEYLLLFRKPPTDSSNGYADDPVVKSKSDYSRSRWQIDAHGYARSSGNRLLTPEDFINQPHERIFKLFRQHSLTRIHDHELHVKLSEGLETCQECGHIHVASTHCGREECQCKGAGRLPVTFMLLQPQSWHEDVWTDITRMLSLNSAQAAAGREMHLCPLQFDLVDRAINQWSNPGEVVYDPFAGLMTVPFRAIKLKRQGWGCELNPAYFYDGVSYCRAAEAEASVPTLFDLALPEASRAQEVSHA